MDQRLLIILLTLLGTGLLWLALLLFLRETDDFAGTLRDVALPVEIPLPDHAAPAPDTDSETQTSAGTGTGTSTGTGTDPIDAQALQPEADQATDARAGNADTDDTGPKVTGADMAASDILVDAVEVVLSLETAGGTVAKCELPDDAALPIGVLFRAGSPVVRAASLIELNRLVDHYRLCNGATVRLSPTLTSSSGARSQEASNSGLVGDDEQRLLERRQQEIKYHLMQRRIPRADIDIRNMPAESGQDTQ